MATLLILPRCELNECFSRFSITVHDLDGTLIHLDTLDLFFGADVRPCGCHGGTDAKGCLGWACTPPQNVEREPGTWNVGMRGRDRAGRTYLGVIPIVTGGSTGCYGVRFAPRMATMTDVSAPDDPANCRPRPEAGDGCGG